MGFINSSAATCTAPFSFRVFSWSSFQRKRNIFRENVDYIGKDFSLTIFGTVERAVFGSKQEV